MRSIIVKKSEGVTELFDSNKLLNSLIKSGANQKNIEEIMLEVQSKIYPEITSDEIYKIAFHSLKRKENLSAVKYSLRRSMLSLGPTGFPFEIYISKIFENKGYKTATGQILKGNCVDHEVDVVAWDSKDLILIETKFHNQIDIKTDVKVALYVKSRFEDLKKQSFSFSEEIKNPTKMMIITNTKFTSQAIEYSRCSGIELIGWDFPHKKNLYNLIEEQAMYPLTSLNSLKKEEKIELIKNGLFDSKTLQEKKELLYRFNINEKKIKRILDEVEEVCKMN